MSHIVTVRTKVRDPVALTAACRRLGLAEPVEGKATPDAIAVLRNWFDDARTSPITAKRFEQQRWNRARRSGLMNATGQELARSLFQAWNMGWEPAVLDDYGRDLASVGRWVCGFFR